MDIEATVELSDTNPPLLLSQTPLVAVLEVGMQAGTHGRKRAGGLD